MYIAHATISDLSSAIAHVMPAVPPKSTLFVLEHIRLSADGDRIELTGTDTEVVITSHLPAHIASPGAVLVPARKLHDIIRALPDDLSCELSCADNKLVLKTSIGRYELPTLNAAEFPDLPQTEHATSVVLAENDVHAIADYVTYAASTEQYRPAMTGVKFEIGSELIAVATDGYRLATISVPLGASPSNTAEAIVPARIVALLAKTMGDVTLGLSRTHAIIASDTVRIVARLIDEQYPQWRNVLPSSSDKQATIARQDLLRAIKRVALFTSSASNLVRFRWNNSGVVLSVTDLDTGAGAEETLPCELIGDPIEIGFNYTYIADALAHMPGERVTFAMTSPSRAVLITPADETGYAITKLVMPMRIG
ncbi:MAG: DNA polymerase III subunit beta [Chlorobi bacterium]|nr:DNA polymerase III subunit beta [Chlorobiota bacterium]